MPMPFDAPINPADQTEMPTGTSTVTGTKSSDPAAAAKKKRITDFLGRISACRQYRRKLVSNWIQSIDYRRGKPFASQTDEDRIVVNLDWSLTKSKQASLFSQIPQVHVDHPPQTTQAGPWLQQFEQRLNDTLVVAGIETAMDESLPDCINAAGIGVVLVSHDSITEQVEVPLVDPSTFPPGTPPGMTPDGQPIPTITIPRMSDHRYTIQRISPADFLWPINFTGADFDNAPWLGRSGRLSWAEAVQKYNLTEEDRDLVLGEDRTTLDRLTHDIDKDKVQQDEAVGFDEIWYKEFQFDPKAKSYTSLHHMVFITGKDEPVVDEPWNGQKLDEKSNTYFGALRYPLRVLTLTYITDETIPPSDSAMGRPQVNEINKSRTQMILQRERSLPVRWFNINGIDPTIQQSLMRGTWQGMIPVQGDGSRYIGEVSRASMPQEDFAFDKIAKDDISEIWQVGANQIGNYSEGTKSATEANVVQQNFSTRIGRERAKVAKFLVSIAEVIGGLLVLYEPQESFGEGFDPSISRTLSYSILADSTVLIDSNQRLQRLTQFINFAAKSGWIDVGPVLKEIATLSGLDPNLVVKPPEPKPPVEPNISLRLTGMEDLLNPMSLAMLMKSGQAPTSDLIEQAKALIASAVNPPAGFPAGLPGMPPPPGPGMPPGPGQPPPPGAPPLPVGPVTPPSPPTPAVGAANPNWELMSKIDKRSGPGER